MRVANKLTPEPKSKMAETRLSIPVESKRAEKMLEPTDEGSQSANTRTKSKMAETRLSIPAESKRAENMLEPADESS